MSCCARHSAFLIRLYLGTSASRRDASAVRVTKSKKKKGRTHTDATTTTHSCLMKEPTPLHSPRGEPLGTAFPHNGEGSAHTPSHPTHPHRTSGLSQRDPHYTSDGRARARAWAIATTHWRPGGARVRRRTRSPSAPSAVDPGAARRAPPPARRRGPSSG